MKLTDVSSKSLPLPQHQIEESVEASGPQENPGVYGIDPKTPEGATAKKRLALLQHTDPELYARVTSLH